MPPRKNDLGVLIDGLYRARAQRLDLERKVDEWKKQEAETKALIIEALQKAKLTAARGKKGPATIVYKDLATVGDEGWPALYAYIKKTGAFELLHKRVSTTACAERWANGEDIPGVAHERKLDISLASKTAL